MLYTQAREYKVMVRPEQAEPEAIWADLGAVAGAAGVPSSGELALRGRSEVEYLDTPTRALLSENLLFRRRAAEGGKVSFTLKRRLEDRYVAVHSRVVAATGFRFVSTFVEEITAPFHSRYSHACTVDISQDRNAHLFARGGLSRLFPLARRVLGEQPLAPVGGRRVVERLFAGGTLALVQGAGRERLASVALIRWEEEDGRILASELSLRYSDRRERYPLELCESARRVFLALQSRPWHAEGATKTGVLFESG